MNLALFVCVAAMSFVVVKAQSASGEAQGSASAGGCSASADGSANADGSPSGSASGSVNCDPAEMPNAHTYVINAVRTSNTMAPGNPVILMRAYVQPTQAIEYMQGVGPENPFMIEPVVIRENDIILNKEGEPSTNSCDILPPTSWEYVAVEMAKQGLIPGNNGCSVEPGNYTIEATLDPITVTLPTKLQCGGYLLIFNAMAPKWVTQMGFNFTIPESDNCT